MREKYKGLFSELSIRMLTSLSKRDYSVWLHEPIWGHTDEKFERKDILMSFMNDLSARLTALGYPIMWKYRSIQPLARLLYAQHVRIYFDPNIYISFDHPEHRNWPEDADQFASVCNNLQEEMEECWKDVEGFDPDSKVGRDFWEEFNSFVYHIIDIDASRHGAIVEQQLNGGYSDMSSDEGGRRGSRGGGRRSLKRANDIYYTEQEQGFHGDDGGRHKH